VADNVETDMKGIS